MSKFDNSKKDSFLQNLPCFTLQSNDCEIAKRCKFNFSFFEPTQEPGQTFSDWGHAELVGLLEKLKEFSRNPLNYWMAQTKGKSHILEIYKTFPIASAFFHPKHVPADVEWGRFRYENKRCLVGFIIPSAYDGQIIQGTKFSFCRNTFYVVFLDKHHKFYLTKKRNT